MQDFLMGYQLIIAIDSTNLSGPYRDSLFFMPAYGVDDDLFPIAFSVINSKKLWILVRIFIEIKRHTL